MGQNVRAESTYQFPNAQPGITAAMHILWGPANSLEHAIPEWLSKRMGIRKLAFHPGHFSEGEGLKVRRLIKCKDLKTRQVCRECNHGWMGKLEEWALAHFGTCVTPDFPPEQFGQLKAVQSQPQQMIRWLLKTAIILELALPKGGMAKVVPALFPVAKGSVEPTDFHVWAAYTCERSFNFHVLRGFPVWNGGVLQPFQIHEGSMNFGLHLNHLALRLFRCPNARPYVVGNVTQLDGLILHATLANPGCAVFVPAYSRLPDVSKFHGGHGSLR